MNPPALQLTAAVALVLCLAVGAPVAAGAAEAVVLLHGIAQAPLVMKPLEGRLKKAGYLVHNLGYPSTSVPIEEAARRVRERLEILGLNTWDRVHFVAHSLGNLVVRRMLQDPPANLGRVVMIAPPNRGSMTAERLKGLGVYRWVFGPAGGQLPAGNEEFFRSLPVPPCEFGIIAGGKGDGKGYNPFLPGDDDGTVLVRETELEGAADFVLLRHTHTLILFARDTAEMTERFLRTGRFR